MTDQLRDLIKDNIKTWPRTKGGGKNIIWLANGDHLLRFIITHPDFYAIKQTRDNVWFVDRHTNEEWLSVIARESSRGYKSTKAIIDLSISEDLFYNVINPSLIVCQKVDFF